MRKALPEDVQRLVALMEEFYAESAYSINLRRAAEAFTALLSNEQLGQVWFPTEFTPMDSKKVEIDFRFRI
jgi:hypothetical protein